MEEREIVSSVLNIENTDRWEIVDRDGDLVIVHYTEPEGLEWLRGVVVDLNRKIIISTGGDGYVRTVLMNDVERYDNATLYYEGATIRVFRANGKTYFATYRKFDMSKSSWEKSPNFAELYDRLNGPSENDLFDTSQPDSPWTHYFIIHVPELFIMSNEKLNIGFLIYQGKRMPEESPFSADLYKTPFFSTEEPFDGSTVPHSLRKYSHEESLYLLQNGYPLFIRERSMKIVNKMYFFMQKIRGLGSNVRYRLYELLDFKTSMPVFERIDIATLPDQIPLSTEPLKIGEVYDNAVRAFYLSVPIRLREKVVTEYLALRNDLINLADLICQRKDFLTREARELSVFEDHNRIYKNLMKLSGIKLYRMIDLMKKNEL